MENTIIDKLAVLLPEADRNVLAIVVEAVIRQILNYTNRDTLPEELVPAEFLISRAYYDSGGLDDNSAGMTSVKRGDDQTYFGNSKAAVTFAHYGNFFGFREMLNPSRVLKFNYSKREK